MFPRAPEAPSIQRMSRPLLDLLRASRRRNPPRSIRLMQLPHPPERERAHKQNSPGHRPKAIPRGRVARRTRGRVRLQFPKQDPSRPGADVRTVAEDRWSQRGRTAPGHWQCRDPSWRRRSRLYSAATGLRPGGLPFRLRRRPRCQSRCDPSDRRRERCPSPDRAIASQ